MLVHRGAESHLVHIQALLAGDVTRDLEGQAVGGVQFKGTAPIQNGFLLLAKPCEQILQMGSARFDRARKADLFSRQVLQYRATALLQFRVEVMIGLDKGFGHLRQERLVQAEFCPEARRAADDHAADVVAASVARHHAVRDQEGCGAGVVGDDAIGREIRVHLGLAVAGQ